MPKPRRQQPIPVSVTVHDFLLKLVSTGQIAIIAVIILLGIIVFRTPAEQMPQVWKTMAELLDRKSGLGYSLSGIVAAGWYVQQRVVRRKHETEYKELAPARTAVQQKHFKKPLSSSRMEKDESK